MSSKRKFTSLGLERRVRARRVEEPEPDLRDESESEAESEAEDGDDGSNSNDEGSGADSDAESSASEEDNAPKGGFSSISFGALARAQESLPPSERKRKTAADSAAAAAAAPTTTKREPLKAKPTRESLKRSSKHAPQETTSKRAVSRRREILADPRPKSRDPRFDPLTGKLDEAKIAKNYAFLDAYRDSEMAELRVQIKKTKNEVKKEELKRQLLSMETRKKARQKKEEADKILEEHRKKEKELVAQGKQPFYLRKSEQKKQALMNRFADMSKSQVDKAIERKRKKVVGKEKKELASLERVQRRH